MIAKETAEGKRESRRGCLPVAVSPALDEEGYGDIGAASPDAETEGAPIYILSGALMPRRPRPRLRTDATAAQRRARPARTAGSSALRTDSFW